MMHRAYRVGLLTLGYLLSAMLFKGMGNWWLRVSLGLPGVRKRRADIFVSKVTMDTPFSITS